MKIGNPITILDPYEWLPSYGESGISFSYTGLDAKISIFYEHDCADGIFLKLRRDILFTRTRAFMKLPFPGNYCFESIPGNRPISIGELIEYKQSDFVKFDEKAWNTSTNSKKLPIRHFNITFLSENLSFHILAIEASLSNAVEVLENLSPDN